MYNWHMADIQHYTVLAADDERSSLLVLFRILSPEFTLLTAKTGGDAIICARGDTPDLILLDIVLPDMGGLDVLRELKGCPDTCDIPVILVSGNDGGEYEASGFGLGAVDYIVKPFSAERLLASVRAHIAADGCLGDKC